MTQLGRGPLLVTPEEAVEISRRDAPCSAGAEVQKIVNAFCERWRPDNEDFSLQNPFWRSWALTTIFYAGEIHGVRRERQRRKEREQAERGRELAEQLGAFVRDALEDPSRREILFRAVEQEAQERGGRGA